MHQLILIDQDGVLADFEQGVMHAYQTQFGEVLPLTQGRRHFYITDDYPEHRHRLRAIYKTQGFFENLPPMAGAIEALHSLLQAGRDVRICTSPIDEYRHCVFEKFAWVERYLGDEWTKRIILTKDKTWVRGDVLIDDKPVITGSLTPTWQHWHYVQPYNAHLAGNKVLWTDKASWAMLLDK